MASRATREHELLEAARGGDEHAFGRLVEPYRAQLHAHCYRMLGSIQDAEDALQETLLRTWRALGRFEGRSSLKSWLYTIATNTSLNAIGKRSRRVLPIDHGPATDGNSGPGEPLVETVWVEPYPDDVVGVEDGFAGPDARYELRESVELAFVAALQHLPPNQRAVLILREVLDFSAREVAEALETTVASVNSALQRSRKAIDERMPEQSQQATLRELGDRRVREIVERFATAMQQGDVAAVTSMLTADAAWSMPPLQSWFRGHDAITTFLANGPLSGRFRWRHLPVHASGQLAVGTYAWRPDEGAHRPFALDVLTLAGDRISAVTAFIARSSDVDAAAIHRWPLEPPDEPRAALFFERFGLPARLG